MRIRSSRYYYSIGKIITDIVFILGGLLFVAVGLWLGIDNVKTGLHERNVLSDGVKIEATVTDSEVTKNGKYYMLFEYEYNGETKQGKTQNSYEKWRVEGTDKITIYVYKDEAYEASSLSKNGVWSGFFGLLPMGFGLVFLVVAIESMVRGFKWIKKNYGATKRESAQYNNYQRESTVNCVKCGRLVELNVNNCCPVCGGFYDLNNKNTTQQNVQHNFTNQNQTEVSSSFCTNCGAKVEGGTTFCTQCGARIEK